MAFARSAGKSQKNAYFWWFFEKFSQTTVIWPKMGLWSIFFLNLIFFILSSKIKKKLVQKTQKQKNGVWSKWRRNRPKSTKIVPLHRRGGPGGAKWEFCRFRPNFKRLPVLCFWVFSCHFFLFESWGYKFSEKIKKSTKMVFFACCKVVCTCSG